eukprot:CAMPEP_0170466660 /NCGR_PEP_ID=MMETSP0123-20130129/10532_1 /TAXON_ID=182087 /ORGANISM="Favella ehrenbergii, Strain Fehren 1" /LENGTH=80 /DNA_ID=CAMNT_0010732835 /DNA_START=40 /DNA_END=282 /DNA_ORIENTATION=-
MSRTNPSFDQYERKMRVGNVLLQKLDERSQPLLASNLPQNKAPAKKFMIGGFVDSASEMSSQAPGGPESLRSSPLEKQGA